MGDVLLGALLGFNQSFERFNVLPDSWSRLSDQASFYQVDCATQVHSSPCGLKTVADSTGGTAECLRFGYGAPGDVPRVWFPAVETHVLKGAVWGRAGDAPSSGQMRWRLLGDSEALAAPFAYGPALQRYEAQTLVTSQAGLPTAGLVRVSAANSGATTYLDDVLTQVDPVTLHPEWNLEEQQRLIRRDHRTTGGQLHSYLWSQYFAFRVPLRWLPRAQADLLNWWWGNQLELAFTLDSSDDASTYICRITNATQPIGRRQRPYADTWEGLLELESINDGRLDF